VVQKNYSSVFWVFFPFISISLQQQQQQSL